MKHGDKKGKSVKAATQASAKAKRDENGSKKAGDRKKAGQGAAAKSSAKKQAAGKEDSRAESKSTAKRAAPEDVSFANPAVAAAFKRSLKKFDSAYRRLTE